MGKITCSFILFALIFTAGPARAETLTLRDCLTKAAAANNVLKVTAFNERVAAQNINVARSGYLPRVDFQGGYTAQLEPQSIKFNSGSFATQEPDYPFFTLSLNQTLYDFGRTHARYKRAIFLKEATAADYEARKKDTFLLVVQAYYGILEGNKLLWAAKDEVEQRKEHLRVARNLYDQGVVTRNDVLQAEVKLADSRQRQMDTANRIEDGWLQLNYLMGQPSDYRAELEEKPQAEPLDPSKITSEQAFANRPEIVSLQKSIQAGESDVKEARSEFFPEIYARLGVDYTKNKTVEEQAIYSATVGLQINLFDGFATTARRRQAVENLSRSREQLRLQEAQIRLELQTAVNDAKVAEERISTIQQSIRQGEENLRINKDRYSEQVGTATDVLDAQTLLTQMRSEYYQAVYLDQVAQARIRKALGRL